MVGLYHTGTKPEFHDTLSDFSDASSLKSVRVLTVRDCRGFDDAALEVVAQMPKLEAFMLDSFMATVAGFEPLQFAKRLLCLCVTVCPRELADTMPPGIECIKGGVRQGDRRDARDKFEAFLRSQLQSEQDVDLNT